MDARTGEIHTLSADDMRLIERGRLAETEKEQRRLQDLMHMVPLSDDQHKTIEPMARPQRKNWMRNQPCPCGSGNKFKKCCWSKYA